jgi:geranylgeranyl diphosphate synthase type II
MHLYDHAEKIEESLALFFEEQLASAKTIHPNYELLWLQIQRLVNSGGKRLRPKMTLLAYRAYGGTNISAVMPLALSQELIHQSMLIHDDIIDNDTLRYGVPNIDGAYRQTYSQFVANEKSRQHFALSAALLGGDLLISAAYKTMLAADVSKDTLSACQQLLSTSIFEVTAGELLDNEISFKPTGEIQTETVARYKTASYSFIGPLLTGAVLAGAPTSEQDLLRVYAENLGIAFQFTDDIIGTFGDKAVTGKSTTSDIREGKMTILVEYFNQNSNAKDLATFNSIFGNSSCSDKEADIIRELLVASGAYKKAKDKVLEYSYSASQALAQLHINKSAHAAFTELINKSTVREF